MTFYQAEFNPPRGYEDNESIVALALAETESEAIQDIRLCLESEVGRRLRLINCQVSDEATFLGMSECLIHQQVRT